MKRSITLQNNTKVMKKPKVPMYAKYKQNVINLLSEIGFKATHVEQIISSVSKLEWKLYYQDYSLEDVVKDIIVTPDLYIESFESFLRECGMKKRKAKYWAQLVLFDSYTHDQKLDFIIEHVVHKYVPTTDKPFLFNPKVVNEWFKHKTYEFYNSESIQHCEEVVRGITMNSNNKQLYYHCTSYGSALSIIKHGPLHYKGRRCCDFGISPSFYLTPHINTALEYCKYLKELYKDEVCIIAFSIDKDEIKSSSYIHFDKASKKWIDTTTDSRLCKSSKNELDDCDFVYGPMVANVNQVKNNIERAKTHKPPKYQLASKTNSSDKVLEKCMRHFIWIQK